MEEAYRKEVKREEVLRESVRQYEKAVAVLTSEVDTVKEEVAKEAGKIEKLDKLYKVLYKCGSQEMEHLREAESGNVAKRKQLSEQLSEELKVVRDRMIENNKENAAIIADNAKLQQQIDKLKEHILGQEKQLETMLTTKEKQIEKAKQTMIKQLAKAQKGEGRWREMEQKFDQGLVRQGALKGQLRDFELSMAMITQHCSRFELVIKACDQQLKQKRQRSVDLMQKNAALRRKLLPEHEAIVEKLYNRGFQQREIYIQEEKLEQLQLLAKQLTQDRADLQAAAKEQKSGSG
eukprot:TRINITY_DN61629_c0_g1_i1.p1 TRINITY_DN61629_c0_g1~~TRINITY_DN61629_c0_g1_i1.p1  ORF type:complete len:292 (+),score=58.30 TRINITY_DN61629_c0_g1_i1:49-924(+)